HRQLGLGLPGVGFLRDLDVEALDLARQLSDLVSLLVRVFAESIGYRHVAPGDVHLHGVLLLTSGDTTATESLSSRSLKMGSSPLGEVPILNRKPGPPIIKPPSVPFPELRHLGGGGPRGAAATGVSGTSACCQRTGRCVLLPSWGRSGGQDRSRLDSCTCLPEAAVAARQGRPGGQDIIEEHHAKPLQGAWGADLQLRRGAGACAAPLGLLLGPGPGCCGTDP